MKSGAKNTGVTVSLCRRATWKRNLSCAGQSITPNRGKTPYIGNQEMSDKLRNRLQKKMPEAGGLTGSEVPCKKSVRIIYTNIVLFTI